MPPLTFESDMPVKVTTAPSRGLLVASSSSSSSSYSWFPSRASCGRSPSLSRLGGGGLLGLSLTFGIFVDLCARVRVLKDIADAGCFLVGTGRLDVVSMVSEDSWAFFLDANDKVNSAVVVEVVTEVELDLDLGRRGIIEVS